jgi:hypothetical protein
MRRHIFVHRATTKYFSNSFVFKTEIEKEGLPGDITPALGAGGLRFKSGRPDQNTLGKSRSCQALRTIYRSLFLAQVAHQLSKLLQPPVGVLLLPTIVRKD